MKRILFIITLTTTLSSISASESKPSWFYTSYAKTAVFFSATTKRTGRFLTTLAGYLPPIARKRSFEQRIAQWDKVIITVDQQEQDYSGYLAKIDRLAQKNASPSVVTPIESDNDDYESSSLVFNTAVPNNLPPAALQPKKLNRRLTSRASLRDLIAEIKQKNHEPPVSMHLNPGLIKAAIVYLGDCLKENEKLYHDGECGAYTRIPMTGIDTETGEVVDYDYWSYNVNYDPYRQFEYKDFRLILGKQTLNVFPNKYYSVEEFFLSRPETEGYRLYNLLKQPKAMKILGLNEKEVLAAYEEHKKNITFFDANKTRCYREEWQHSTLVNEYVTQSLQFMKENQDFRKGFVDDKGITHQGWLTLLAREKTVLGQQMDDKQNNRQKRLYYFAK